MKKYIILLSLFLTLSLNAQERIIHSATLGCYIDLDKVVGITDLHNKWTGMPSYGYELRYGPDKDWRFTIIYQFRNDYNYQFYADSAKAQEVYYRIVNKWKEYTKPHPKLVWRDRYVPYAPGLGTPSGPNLSNIYPDMRTVIITMLEEDIAWMHSTRLYAMSYYAPDPWSRSIKTSKEIIKLLK